MFLKHKREINYNCSILSEDIFDQIELRFSNIYKLSKVSDRKFCFKKKYIFKTNGWEEIYKKLSIDDNGIIELFDNKIAIKLNLSNQILATILGILLFVFVIWKLLGVGLIISLIVILLSALLIWVMLILDGLHKLDILHGKVLNGLKKYQ